MTKFEPPSLINRPNRCASPFYVPPAASRNVPENLILEMVSGVFFPEFVKEHRGENSPLKPQDIDARKNFAVNALRGREGKGPKSEVMFFYAPIYPSLAKDFTIRRKQGDMIENFLWQGPIAYGLRMRDAGRNGTDVKKLARLVVKALAGDTASPPSEKSDVFALACGSINDIDPDDLSDKLATKLSKWKNEADLIPSNSGNSLAKIALDDFELLLTIEPWLPRHHWMTLLMCYLRLTLPIWCFSQGRGVEILDRLLMQSLTKGVPSKKEIEKEYENCSKGLFCPSDNWSTIIDDRIRTSILARIRTDALLHDLADAGCLTREILTDHTLSISTDDIHQKIISVHTLLKQIHDSRDRYTKYLALKKEYEDIDKDRHQIERCLNRLCEHDSRFRKPVKCPLGTSIKEFTNYLLRECIPDDDRGSHLLRWRKNPRMIWQVSPGPLVLQLFTLLAFHRKAKARRGELVLLDLEEHLAIYGIDYSKQPNGRSLLINGLTRRGLLIGSPDAGEGAKIRSPYPDNIPTTP